MYSETNKKEGKYDKKMEYQQFLPILLVSASRHFKTPTPVDENFKISRKLFFLRPKATSEKRKQ